MVFPGKGRKCHGWRWPLAASALAAALWSAAAAANVDAPVGLSVHLTTQGVCDRRVDRDSRLPFVTVHCTPSGAVVAPARFLLHVYWAGQWLGTVDGTTGDGTITSWRVLRVADRDYLEIMVAW